MPADTNRLRYFRESLDKIRRSKDPVSGRSRRYSLKEKELILEAVEELGRGEVISLCGIRGSTLSTWTRRKRPAPVEDVEPHYDGYHPHWQEVLDLWRSKPGLGPAQVSRQLRRKGIKVSISTVRNILEENGYSPPKAKEKAERVLRYEAARPRELIHMDFKHFYINKQKVYLLLLQDDCSRFLCGYRLTDSENMDAVIGVFEECVERYGKMQMLMTDAGSSFYSWNGLNRFQKLIADEYGVDHIKASSPRSNGKLESVNKQIEKELLRVKHFSSLEEADLGIAEWIQFYNFERTHMGLSGEQVPADRFLYGWDTLHKGESHKPEPSVWEDVLKVAIGKMK